MINFAFFDTPIGACAILWGRQGIVGLFLPEADAQALRRRVLRREPAAQEARPLPGIDLAIRDIVRLLSGEPVDLSRIALDMDGLPEFERRVYELARTVPPGSVVTYGEIAVRLGDPGASRAVGQALGRNPFPIVVPCHRVMAADGKPGGFSARGGVATKLRMLTIEHARTTEAPTLFDAHGGLPFRAAS
jgi:methylated-DNA-[protein]-cysteine S-methyltransferase